MEVITYSLRENQPRSDGYYQDIAAFAADVTTTAENRLRQPLADFQAYLSRTAREPLRSTPEYALELLTLGVLWNIYAPRSGNLPRLPQQALVSLVSLRQRNARLKPLADWLRGRLHGLFMRAGAQTAAPPNTIPVFDRWLAWLQASGDFPQEILRLAAWRDFLQTLPPEQIAHILADAQAFAAWFEQASQQRLGRYTPQVESFRAETRASYRWRRDAILCGRRQVEYHLNMVGVVILNQAFREAYLRARRKILFLPPCMRAKTDSECQATATPLGELCAACTPGCRVNQLTRLGQKHGFQVLMIPDDLSTLSSSSGSAQPAANGQLGVVGVSCVLTNLSGGWETRAQNIPAQGLPLDYCGCSYHWHAQGIPTDINLSQLLKVMGIDSPPAASESPADTTAAPLDAAYRESNGGVST